VRETTRRESARESTRETGAAVRRLALAALVPLLVALAAAPAVAAPAWRLDVLSNTTAPPGGVQTYAVQITNVGDATMNLATTPVRFSGSYPSGLTALSGPPPPPPTMPSAPRWDCSTLVVGAQSFSCQLASGTIPPWGTRTFTVEATVGADAGGVLTGNFTVAGGAPGIAPATRADPTTITATEPPFGVDALDGEVVDAAGVPFTQAGGHPPEASVSIDFNTITDPATLKGRLWPVAPVRNVLADLPPGLVGDPTGAATCTAAELANTAVGLLAKALCPSDAQVGLVVVRLNGVGAKTVWGPLPIFNMVPPPDVPARFGFNVAGTVVVLDGELRSAGDYGLSVRVRNIPQGLAIAGATLTFWGVPSDDAHNRERACDGETAPWEGGPTCDSGAPRRAFLRNPTSCTEPGVGLPVTVRLDSWVRPGDFEEASFVSHRPPGYPLAPADWGPEVGPENCGAVPFDPGLAVTPGSGAASAPSGFAFEVTLPQSDDPDAVGQSDLRRAVVRLPLGVRVNPSAADGLQGCSPAQIGLDSLAEPSCPDGSRVGSLTIETPLLDEPLSGGVYLASPRVNPFGALLAVYLVARGPGLIVKLAGRVDADLLSGQLTAVFDELPQLPFSSVRLAFDGGPRAPLVNPPLCGSYAVEGELTGWSGAVASVVAPFSLVADAAGAPCPAGAGPGAGGSGAGSRPFAPGFAAGVEDPRAGASSPFHLRMTRTDADDEFAGLSMRLPRGLVGRVADVTLCAEGDAAAGTCPEGSRVGTVAAGAGAGPLPFWIRGGRVYMTGPYRGAPFGLSIVVPAVAGPFDLGLVVVRAAVFVDRRTAAITVEADPFPTIFEGIPLQLRDVRVAVDRPGFMLNPTSCAGGRRVRGVLRSVAGRVVGLDAPFAAAECGRLRFAPRLRLFVGAPGRVRAGVSTPLTAVLTQRPGEAGIRRVSVTLPDVLNARLEVVEDACTPEEFDLERDPSAGPCGLARIGTAVAVTPLLRDPLRGEIYLVKQPGRPTGLPNIVIALRGQVDFDLVGRVAIPGGRLLRAIFPAVPDVPISRFVLRLGAGPRGVVGVAAGLCSRRGLRARAAVVIAGQAGSVRHLRRPVLIRGC
jgi:hypothetical protein